ncbi:MAG: uracil-DNA glycosylase family protein [Pseudomonadota bacterium]
MSERPNDPSDQSLARRLSACRLCAPAFKATETAHAPAPVIWFRPGARILIAGQAPGLRVHRSGKPFTDRSGDRLRVWLGLDEAGFYDLAQIAIVPAAFCFPGYNARGADLPPPRLCGATWHQEVMAHLGRLSLKILIGSHAHRLHLGLKGSLTEAVRGWRAHAPATFLLPHPSWRNNAWLRKNPWFEAELLPELRRAVRAALHQPEAAFQTNRSQT